MGWEKRKGAWYYYRKERRGGKVVSECCGAKGSVLATICSERDGLRRERQAISRRLMLAELQVLDDEEQEVREFCAEVERLERAALEAAGYHRHDRGIWRKRRMNEMAKSSPLAWPAILTGGLVASLERTQIQRMFPGDDEAAARQAMVAELATLRAEVAGPRPTPLERLMADRVALCWLQLQILELGCIARGNSVEFALRLENRRDQAHRRYLQSIKTLAQVRRLQLPAMQVNVAMDGGQQVNVAGVPS